MPPVGEHAEAPGELLIDLGAHRVGIERRQVGGVPDLLAAESVAVGEADVAGAVAANVAPESAVVRRRVSGPSPGTWNTLPREHPVADVFADGSYVDARRVIEAEPPKASGHLEAGADRLIQIERDAVGRVERRIRRCAHADKRVGARPESRVELDFDQSIVEAEAPGLAGADDDGASGRQSASARRRTRARRPGRR